MSFFGLRKWPTPFLKPMLPFIAAGGITYYLVSKAQSTAIQSEEFKNDARNPYREQLAKQSAHH